MDVDAVNLFQETTVISAAIKHSREDNIFTVVKTVTYRSHSVYDDISHLHPTLQWKHLKESQHGVAHIIEVEVSRVCPEKYCKDMFGIFVCSFY